MTINFYFLKMFLNMTSVVFCRILLHFMSSLINNFKKYNSLPLTGINTFFEKNQNYNFLFSKIKLTNRIKCYKRFRVSD